MSIRSTPGVSGTHPNQLNENLAEPFRPRVSTAVLFEDELVQLDTMSCFQRVRRRAYRSFPHFQIMYSSKLRKATGISFSLAFLWEQNRYECAKRFLQEKGGELFVKYLGLFNLNEEHEYQIFKELIEDTSISEGSKESILVYFNSRFSVKYQNESIKHTGMQYRRGKVSQKFYLAIIKSFTLFDGDAKDDFTFTFRNEPLMILNHIEYLRFEPKEFTRWLIFCIERDLRSSLLVTSVSHERKQLPFTFSDQEWEEHIQLLCNALQKTKIQSMFIFFNFHRTQFSIPDEKMMQMALHFGMKREDVFNTTNKQALFNSMGFLSVEQVTAFNTYLNQNSTFLYYKFALKGVSFNSLLTCFPNFKFSNDVARDTQCLEMLLEKCKYFRNTYVAKSADRYFLKFLDNYPSLDSIPDFCELDAGDVIVRNFKALLEKFPKLIEKNCGYFVEKLGHTCFKGIDKPDEFDDNLWDFLVSEELPRYEFVKGKEIPVDDLQGVLSLPEVSSERNIREIVSLFENKFKPLIGNTNSISKNIKSSVQAMVNAITQRKISGLPKQSPLYETIEKNIKTIIHALERLLKEETDKRVVENSSAAVFVVLCHCSINCVAPYLKEIPKVGYKYLKKYLPISEQEAEEIAKRLSDPKLALKDYFLQEVKEYIDLRADMLFKKYDDSSRNRKLTAHDIYEHHRHTYFVSQFSKRVPVTYTDEIIEADPFQKKKEKIDFDRVEADFYGKYNLLDAIRLFQERLEYEGLFSSRKGSQYDVAEWMNTYIKKTWPGLPYRVYSDPEDKLPDAFYDSGKGKYKPSCYLVADLLRNAGLVKKRRYPVRKAQRGRT